MRRLENRIEIPVVDPQGELIEMREIANCPIAELYPEEIEHIILIDWMASTTQRPDVETLERPVVYLGEEYMGDKYWGSAVKIGTTIGVRKAFLDKKIVKTAEDGQRVQRYLFGQGHWGGVVGEGIRVKVLPEGTKTQWGLVADGAGFISRKFAEKGFNGNNKIKLGRARESYTFWQRVRPWTQALEDELMPAIKQAVENAGNVAMILTEYSPSSFDDKKELYDANKDLEYHPYLVNSIARASGEIFTRIATTVNVGTKVGIAVPTEGICVIPKLNGRVGIYRHPVDSDGSMQAVKASKKEQEYVANSECIQHTMSGEAEGHDLFAKGVFRIVDTDEFDVLVCAEDIKMWGGALEVIRGVKEFLFNGVVAFNQWFAKGCAVGVRPSFGKDRMGLDYDGDLVDYFNGELFPVLWQTIKDQQEAYTKKLEKSKSPLFKRAVMIYKSMMNLVGMATKQATDTFMVTDRQLLALELGFKILRDMEIILNYWIKVGTDGFKTDIDQEPIRAEMSVFQSKIHKLLGCSAPYSNWPNDWAFKHGVPQLWHPDMEEREAKESIRPWMDGTVPTICRLTLPHLENILGEPFRSEPLTKFRGWVKEPHVAYLAYATKLQDWYNARSKSVNWQDSDRIIEFKFRWQDEVQNLINMVEADRYELAQALWWVAHSARSSHSGAGSVFMAFHKECLRIVTERPGYSNEFETILTGMNYQLPNYVGEEMIVDVEVVDIDETKNGRRTVRKAIVATVAGQLQPRNDKYPKNMIAMVATNANQPEVGTYTATIKRYSKNAFKAVLK
ncbi:MAG: hypothetical protein ACWGQW_05565 [bacterium]